MLFPDLPSSPTFVLLLWKIGSSLNSVPIPVPLSLCDLLLPYLHSDAPSRSKEKEQEFLCDLYHGYGDDSLIEQCLSNNIPSFIPMCFEEQTQRVGFLLETVLLCPLTKLQVHCLNSLWARWGFLLSESRTESMYSDVLMSTYLEMIRIYSHPFLAGCSESLACSSSEKWAASFRDASAKVRVMEYVMKCTKQVEDDSWSNE